MPPRRPDSIPLDSESQRQLAKELFNYVWTLLEDEHRGAEETELMVAAAYASRLFWHEPGGPIEHIRSQWQISRACATAGQPEAALDHASRCLEICEEHGIDGFDLASAHEAMARAHLAAGHTHDAREFADEARSLAEQIPEASDREVLERDLATLPS